MKTSTIAPVSTARPPRWHVIYSLLALFVALVVGLALVLVHRIVTSYDRSVSTNEEWEDRLLGYSNLNGSASAVAAAAGAALTSPDVTRDRARLADAVQSFERDVAVLRADLGRLSAEEATALAAGLDEAVQRVGAQAVAAEQAFSLIEGRGPGTALVLAAKIEEERRALVGTVIGLVGTVSTIQRTSFQAQQDEIVALQRFEYLVAGFFLVMVLGATYYGSRLRREFERQAAERDAHVARLESTEADLREARDVLEERVRARTHELALANASLQAQVDERRRAEADLRLSEERYALAAGSANDGLWDWDLQADHFYYSPRWRSLLGYEQDELARSVQVWLRRVHPEDRPDLEACIRAHLENTSLPLETEHRVLHRDGTYRWMLVRATAVMDSLGSPTRMVGSHADVTARKNAELQLLHDAFHDTLTGLPNRALFIDRLDIALRRTRRPHGATFGVLFIDLDRFKVVNDSLGHVLGDDLLVEVGQRLASVVRPGDVVARFGGDEFTILVDNLATDGDAVIIADRVLAALTEPIHLNGYDIRASASIGIALGADHYITPAEVLRDADTAMYKAKADGRSKYRLFEPSMHDSAVDSLVLETDLRVALERHQLGLLYQPIVSLSDSEIVGFEALVRWHHPTRGVIPPATFIVIAEESGDIVPMGRWVLSEACGQLARWQQADPDCRPLYIAVNVSPRELLQAEFVEHLERTLCRTGLEPSSLRLEITESSVMRNRRPMIDAMQALTAIGVGISIDDFGTGYSTLSYIKDLPVDTLKIDRAFIAGLSNGGKDAELVRTILDLGRSLNLQVVAEGIETRDQRSRLVELACPFGQGYHYFEPLEAAEIDSLIASTDQRTKITG